MKPYLLRPYSGRRLPENTRVFNYRLSRAHRVVENTFGILTQRWRVYTGRLQVGPETADSIVRATCILHNMLRSAKIGGQNPDDEPDEDEVGVEDEEESILRPIQ
ncbi:protein ALP1-like [Xyrichtys novacula]|uniref:Protein ALP1-like n=1 Tax=Xyrichtys novacula TaxID=13765 RepID=A0AAV1H553_XYRNO|nr:protein ALP1-like [Xyrichtys novacula]